MYKLIVALVLGLALAAIMLVLALVAYADKAVTYLTPTTSDITQVYMRPVAASVCAAGWQANVIVAVRKSDGTKETTSLRTGYCPSASDMATLSPMISVNLLGTLITEQGF